MYVAFIGAGMIWLLLGDSRDFDERQQINRGKAMYFAIWNFFVYAIIAMLCSSIYDAPIFHSPFYILLIGCALVMLTYLTVAIILDAYVPLNFPGIVYLYLVFGTVSIVASLFEWPQSSTMAGDFRWILLTLGIVFLWAGLLMIIMKAVRKLLDSKSED